MNFRLKSCRTSDQHDGAQLRRNSVKILLRIFPIPILERDNDNKTKFILNVFRNKNTNKFINQKA